MTPWCADGLRGGARRAAAPCAAETPTDDASRRRRSADRRSDQVRQCRRRVPGRDASRARGIRSFGGGRHQAQHRQRSVLEAVAGAQRLAIVWRPVLRFGRPGLDGVMRHRRCSFLPGRHLRMAGCPGLMYDFDGLMFLFSSRHVRQLHLRCRERIARSIEDQGHAKKQAKQEGGQGHRLPTLPRPHRVTRDVTCGTVHPASSEAIRTSPVSALCIGQALAI